jgi:hypothetical protein
VRASDQETADTFLFDHAIQSGGWRHRSPKRFARNERATISAKPLECGGASHRFQARDQTKIPATLSGGGDRQSLGGMLAYGTWMKR